MKHILLIGTGGTIASKRSENGLKPLLSSEELLSYVPDSKSFCQVDNIQIFNIDSTNVRPAHWQKIANTIEDHYQEYDGFVVCHGTDTMAYTLSLIHISAYPQGSQGDSRSDHQEYQQAGLRRRYRQGAGG